MASFFISSQPFTLILHLVSVPARASGSLSLRRVTSLDYTSSTFPSSRYCCCWSVSKAHFSAPRLRWTERGPAVRASHLRFCVFVQSRRESSGFFSRHPNGRCCRSAVCLESENPTRNVNSVNPPLNGEGRPSLWSSHRRQSSGCNLSSVQLDLLKEPESAVQDLSREVRGI